MTTHTSGAARVRRGAWTRVAAVLSAAAVIPIASCKDSNVPYFIAPTSVTANAVGVQNGVTGVFSGIRDDQFFTVLWMATFGRDAANFTNTEDRYITELGGIAPIPGSDFAGVPVWDPEFSNAAQTNAVMATARTVAGYTTDSLAALQGVMQTMKALDFMYIAETHDTLGVPIYSIVQGISAPAYCNKDVWEYIVALLDSGNAALNLAATTLTALPVKLPSGFGNVDAIPGPSTAPGSFAAFNRALAGKAGLELAYAIARGTGGNPTPTSAGTPNVAALTRADSAIKASALFAPTMLGPFPASGFSTAFDNGVYHVFSAQSGDIVNPINGVIGTLVLLWDLAIDVDTLHDLRWAAKVTPINPALIQEATFNAIAYPATYSGYPNVSTPMPIVRNEELTLVDAEIQLGLGNEAAAMTLVNDVHEEVGGYTTPIVATTYTAVRDSLLNEMQISTLLEGSDDRTIAIRFYGLPAVVDTTWDATAGPDAVAVASVEVASGAPVTDLHTTVIPIPTSELNARAGVYTLSCP